VYDAVRSRWNLNRLASVVFASGGFTSTQTLMGHRLCFQVQNKVCVLAVVMTVNVQTEGRIGYDCRPGLGVSQRLDLDVRVFLVKLTKIDLRCVAFAQAWT
jgi:hypothetical protein